MVMVNYQRVSNGIMGEFVGSSLIVGCLIPGGMGIFMVNGLIMG